MASYGTLKVSPAELVLKSEIASARIFACKTALEHIATAIRSSDAFWQGEAADLVRQVFEKEAKSSLEALEELSKYPQDLLQYNGLYSEVINRTQGLADQISSFSMQ